MCILCFWEKDNKNSKNNVVTDGARVENLPEDDELPDLRTVQFSETERIDDQGLAPQQLNAGETDSADDSTVSGIILPEPGVNVQAQVKAAINDVASEPREGEAGESQQSVHRSVIPWPTTNTTPASEFTTPYFLRRHFLACFPMERVIST